MGAGGSIASEDVASAGIQFCEDNTNELQNAPKLQKSLRKYMKMLKAGVPGGACMQAASIKWPTRKEHSQRDIDAFAEWCAKNKDFRQITKDDIAQAVGQCMV